MDYVIEIQTREMESPLISIVQEDTPDDILRYLRLSWLAFKSRSKGCLCFWNPYTSFCHFANAFALRERDAIEMPGNKYKLAPIPRVSFDDRLVKIYLLEDWINSHRGERTEKMAPEPVVQDYPPSMKIS
jgi:hypothetical protein